MISNKFVDFTSKTKCIIDQKMTARIALHARVRNERLSSCLADHLSKSLYA